MRCRFAAVLIFACIFTAFGGSGCAAIRAASARNQVLHARTAEHVYKLQCQQLWPSVQALLFERGYAAAGSGPGGMLVTETQWRSEVRGSNTYWVRYLVQAFVPGPNQCQVMFTKSETQTPGMGAPYNVRDLDSEWVLLQRMDRPAAEQIAAEANTAGDRAAGEN